MTIDRDAVTVLVPTLNEAPTIQALVRDFAARGYTRVLVVDGRSTDGTAALATEAGAEVLVQSGRGKGNAVIEAFRCIATPYVLMLDGDGTYSADDADRMVAPLFQGVDQVIGDRLGAAERGALSPLNRAGNYLLNRLFRLAHGRYLSDILSGYRAFTRASLEQMNLAEQGFGIETEIAVEAVRNSHRVSVVPVSHDRRAGTATAQPAPGRIQDCRDHLPARANEQPALLLRADRRDLALAGVAVGAFVLYEWFQGIERLPLTILTVLLITVGIQVFVFGLIGDLILSFHRETMDEIAALKRQLEEGR